ncbi:predicted protein [Naegleria gruberi]|uniref:Predicted protein n=1 Tax=Naegleria gruberi TaxID=5762 RepID=D2VFI7_NAEGR|nr:uncharacterized protein NAEGRDRAFT_67641 [Naegleria gruberi]EFC44472.1 predicted protein [Naegleria gruberi]|eukprot:XP_002677216.1 predicted protein [Naegleria gruberi strain NEG-M]
MMKSIRANQISDKLSKELKDQADKLENDLHKYVNNEKKIDSHFTKPSSSENEFTKNSNSSKTTSTRKRNSLVKKSKEPISLIVKLVIVGFVIGSFVLWYFFPGAFRIVFGFIKVCIATGAHMASLLFKLLPFK